MRVAVVGHVEWIEFVPVEQVPRPGEIVHASEPWEQAGGGGAVAAVQFAALGNETILFTTLGADALGRRAAAELEGRGVRVHASSVEAPTRRALTFVDLAGERTITTLGARLEPHGHDGSLPWEEIAGCDAAYYCAGDVDALLHARRARILVATAREAATLRRAAIELDAVVGSGEDEAERQEGDLDPPPMLVVSTSGALGGWARPGGPFAAAPPPGTVVDSYGAGDCFAAGLAHALASGLDLGNALSFAARCGAGALAGRGVYAEPVAP